MRLNPGSFTVATESTEGTGDKRKELFTIGLPRDQFFLFLGDNIGLITSVLFPSPPLPLKNWKISSNAGEGGRGI